MAQKKFFVREASGLVREFGSVDLLLMASACVFALVYSTLQFSWFYGFNQGADLPIALVISSIPFLILMIVYWGIGIMMPRSGSDYVWIGRIMHPSIGFAWSFLYMFAFFSIGFVGPGAALGYAISIALAIWGTLYNVPGAVAAGTWFSTSIGSFVMSSLLTLAFAALALFGAKAVKRFLYVSWAFAIVGIGLMWGLLATTTPAMFAAKWDSILSQYTSYEGMLKLATQSGWVAPTFSIAATLISLPLAADFLLGGNYANVVAGEVKDVKRNIPLALVLSLIFGIIFWTVSSTLTLNAVGHNWMYAVGYLFDNNPAAYSAAMPYPPTQLLILSLIAYPSQLSVSVMLVTYIVGSLAALFMWFWISTRYFFAWAFDRIIPTKMADVSKQFRTPHNAIGITTVMAIVLFGLYYFTSWSSAFTLGVFIVVVAYVVPGLATLILPLTLKKDLLELAPGFMRKRIGPVPFISVLGLIVAVSYGYLGYLSLINPLITVPTTAGVGVAVGIAIACFLVYYFSVWYHKRKGLDIELAFKEIPPV
jgi:APA family basic amino acid/polyamine antiporter